FPQILLVSSFCFALALRTELATLANQPAWLPATLVVFAGQMLWGMYQEYVYRGLLQTELVRRWGPVARILVSNLIFTFGPLHAYHFGIASDPPGHLLIFLIIFAIGLYFGVLFFRSGNLWMIAVLHGLGDFFLDGIAKLQ